MSTKKEIAMRNYNAGDVFAVVDILTAVTKDVDSLRHIIKVVSNTVNKKGDNRDKAHEEAGQEIILYILNNCYAHARDGLIDWFAGLYGMTREEYLNQPPEMVLETIEIIATREESKDFFTRALQAFKRIRGLERVTKSA